jgi:nicotinate-nucleotide adenylyltransferase
MMRIGLFGGTFNPFHLGHLEVARDVQTGLALDKIIFIPAALPPHKAPGWIADAEDRLAMLRLALADRPSFLTSDVELQRKGPSYTIDTVHYYGSRYHDKGELFLIIGLDAFLEIDTWKSYKALFKSIQMVVMSRPSAEDPDAEGYQPQIEAYLQSTISSGYRYVPDRACFSHAFYQPVIPFAVSPMAISATQIRDRIKDNQSIKLLVPEGVAAYINQRGLYR